jgi:hypothetical protein
MSYEAQNGDIETGEPWTLVREAWRLKMEPWRACVPEVASLHQSERSNPDTHHSERSDPYLNPDPHRSEKVDPDPHDK